MSWEMEKWTRPWSEIESAGWRAGANANPPSAKVIICEKEARKWIFSTPIPDSSFQSSLLVSSFHVLGQALPQTLINTSLASKNDEKNI